MSRIGKMPVNILQGVKVYIDKTNIVIEGPKGKIDLDIPNGISVEQKDSKLIVSRDSDLKQNKANHGTIRSIISNMVIGVTSGHKKELELKGIGFRMNIEGKKLICNIGFSHLVEFDLPEDINVYVSGQNILTIEGNDNTRVGQVAAKIKALKPVEPYKGKGFRYVGEIVKRKQGKSVTK